MTGKCSTFGGPNDNGMTLKEGLSCFEHSEGDFRLDLFLPRSSDPLEPIWKRLRPNALYFAYRFPLTPRPPRDQLQSTSWLFTNPKNGLKVVLQLVDYGPARSTDRTFDISPYASDLLRVQTDQEIVGEPLTTFTGISGDTRVLSF